MSLQLNHFLKTVQSKAFAQAEYAVSNREEALDIVQDSMMKLASSYLNKPESEWPMLFQRILQNQIRDWYRKQKVRRVIFWWEQYQDEEQPIPEAFATDLLSPDSTLESDQSFNAIGQQVKSLPLRQQQVFILRAFWGHSIEETATILGCTIGTVKTHYSRAVNTLGNKVGAII